MVAEHGRKPESDSYPRGLHHEQLPGCTTYCICSAHSIEVQPAGSLRANVAHAVLEVDRRHRRGISPPELSNDVVSRKPGVRLLEFVRNQQFRGVESLHLWHDQVLVRGTLVTQGAPAANS